MTEASYEKWRKVELERGVPQPTWGQLSPEEQAKVEGPEELPDGPFFVRLDKPAGLKWYDPEEKPASGHHSYGDLHGPFRNPTLADAPPDSDEGELTGKDTGTREISMIDGVWQLRKR